MIDECCWRSLFDWPSCGLFSLPSFSVIPVVCQEVPFLVFVFCGSGAGPFGSQHNLARVWLKEMILRRFLPISFAFLFNCGHRESGGGVCKASFA